MAMFQRCFLIVCLCLRIHFFDQISLQIYRHIVKPGVLYFNKGLFLLKRRHESFLNAWKQKISFTDWQLALICCLNCNRIRVPQNVILVSNERMGKIINWAVQEEDLTSVELLLGCWKINKKMQKVRLNSIQLQITQLRPNLFQCNHQHRDRRTFDIIISKPIAYSSDGTSLKKCWKKFDFYGWVLT